MQEIFSIRRTLVEAEMLATLVLDQSFVVQA
jgi:hypothetical protein